MDIVDCKQSPCKNSNGQDQPSEAPPECIWQETIDSTLDSYPNENDKDHVRESEAEAKKLCLETADCGGVTWGGTWGANAHKWTIKKGNEPKPIGGLAKGTGLNSHVKRHQFQQ